MAVYSTLLARNYHAGTLSALTIYTAPSVGVVVVRDIVLMHDGSGDHSLDLYTSSGSSIARLVRAFAQHSGETLHWVGRQVLAPGEVLVLASDSTGNIYYRVTGYILGQ